MAHRQSCNNPFKLEWTLQTKAECSILSVFPFFFKASFTYLHIKEEKNFTSAVCQCEAKGYHLVTPDANDELVKLCQNFSEINRTFWLGYQRTRQNRTTWLNGIPLAEKGNVFPIHTFYTFFD